MWTRGNRADLDSDLLCTVCENNHQLPITFCRVFPTELFLQQSFGILFFGLRTDQTDFCDTVLEELTIGTNLSFSLTLRLRQSSYWQAVSHEDQAKQIASSHFRAKR